MYSPLAALLSYAPSSLQLILTLHDRSSSLAFIVVSIGPAQLVLHQQLYFFPQSSAVDDTVNTILPRMTPKFIKPGFRMPHGFTQCRWGGHGRFIRWQLGNFAGINNKKGCEILLKHERMQHYSGYKLYQ